MSGNILVQRLRTVFGAPERENVNGYLDEIANLTDHFGPSVLNAAAARLIRSGGRSWPAPKAIVDACIEAQETISADQARRPRADRPMMPWEAHADLARAWAKSFCIETPLGRQAFDEGWGRHLFQYAQSFAREAYRRVPVPPGKQAVDEEWSLQLRNATPRREQFSIPNDWLIYYRGSADLRVHRDVLVARAIDAGTKPPGGHVTPASGRDLDRHALLGEPFSPETEARLAAKVAALARGESAANVLGFGLKRMPVAEPEPEHQPVGQLPKRIKAEPPRLPPSDRNAWAARFGNRSAGLPEDAA